MLDGDVGLACVKRSVPGSPLSGGSTPRTVYELLASDEWVDRFPWHLASWYWGDERFVPPTNPDSNFRMMREAMFAKRAQPVRESDARIDAASRLKSNCSLTRWGWLLLVTVTSNYSRPS